jgi:hypothetical protein
MTSSSSNKNDTNEWVQWIEDKIAKNYINCHDYNEFQSIQHIGGSFGAFGDVYKANWKETVATLKSFKNDSRITKEISIEVNNTKTFKR